jgi:membrane protein DedA with SNARE-associated domain
MRATDTSFLLAAAVALIAILIQDTGYFAIARIFGPKIIRHKLFAKFIKPRSIVSGERYFHRRGPFIVFSSRFVVGLRAPVIMSAGFLRMHWPRFIRYDFLAAVIMTPAWMLVGYALGAQFDDSVGSLSKFFAFLAPVAVIAGAFLIYRSVKADKARSDSESCADGPSDIAGAE